MVISRTKTIESWSSWKAISAWNPSAKTQVNKVCPTERSSAECPIMATSINTASTADPTTVSTPRYGPHELVRRPPSSSTAAPKSGKAISSQIRENTPDAGMSSIKVGSSFSLATGRG